MAGIFETPLYAYRRSPDQDADKPPRHPVVVVGAGPVGLALGIDLALKGVPVVILDDNDRVSWGSRAICFAKRPLEILDRLGCGDAIVEKGVTWNTGKVFFDRQLIYTFDLLAEDGHKRPAFINLQQYHFEKFLIERLRQLQRAGVQIDLRGRNRVIAVKPLSDHVRVTIETPQGGYDLAADWLVACDGAASPVRRMMKLDFAGNAFTDNFLIADVRMEAGFPSERWFWFDPPFNRGRSALLHKQPDDIWRIDLQLGRDIDREAEKRPDKVVARLKAMLGEEVEFDLEWVSIYSFQCGRMKKFRHGRILFAGDSAHQVSPFGARGANSGIQDADNLAWKLQMVINGGAPEKLLDSYDAERIPAAEENITNSLRSTGFITPDSAASRAFRDAVLELAGTQPFARPLVNSGRLSVPSIYDNSPLNGADAETMPARTRPGAPACDAPVRNRWLLDHLGGRFILLALNLDIPNRFECNGIPVATLSLTANESGGELLAARYLGMATQAVYLIRPDQHIAARWQRYDEPSIRRALETACGRN
jgi:3-(3-hydroxy-phenyl)propionate hydroxylase